CRACTGVAPHAASTASNAPATANARIATTTRTRRS
ncbi:MAG: hypothetical protein QOG76_1710, partial [Pseudonocardiales bacterium]|nr:hypothetical protein [Pseudonocardiales bacterium]